MMNQTKEETLTISVVYSERREGGGACNKPAYINTTFQGAWIGKLNAASGGDVECFELPRAAFRGGEPTRLFLAVLYYTDGDTFGSTGGHKQFEGLFLDLAEAHVAARRAEAGYSHGYFDRFESVEVVTLEILGTVGGKKGKRVPV